jgi:hypothetical protein
MMGLPLRLPVNLVGKFRAECGWVQLKWANAPIAAPVHGANKTAFFQMYAKLHRRGRCDRVF